MGLQIIFLVYAMKSAMFKLFLGLHYMGELVNFRVEAFFAKDFLATLIKIYKSKDKLQSVLSNSIG